MSSIFIKIAKYCIIITSNKLKHELKERSKTPRNKKCHICDHDNFQFLINYYQVPGGTV